MPLDLGTPVAQIAAATTIEEMGPIVSGTDTQFSRGGVRAFAS